MILATVLAQTVGEIGENWQWRRASFEASCGWPACLHRPGGAGQARAQTGPNPPVDYSKPNQLRQRPAVEEIRRLAARSKVSGTTALYRWPA